MNQADTSRDLSAALGPWRWRLALKRGVAWALHGLAGGTGVAATMLGVARFVPWPGVMLWAGLSLAAGLVAGLVYGLVSRPSLIQVARRTDRLMGLSDRLSTAWELRNANTAIACLQRENALSSLRGYQPTEAIRLRPGRRAFAPLLAGLVLLGTLLVLPNPMDKVIQERQELQEKLAIAAEKVSQTRQEMTKPESPLSAEERLALEDALKKLEEALNSAQSPPEALKALARAEEEIKMLEQKAVQSKALQEIGAALSGSAATEGLGQALASGDEAALREAMNILAEQIKGMSPEELQELASTLQQVANAAAAQDEAIAGILRSAARSVASGEAGQGANALENLQDELATLQAGTASESAINQVVTSLRNARSSISGVATAQAGQGAGSGQGAGRAGGNGSGNGNGSSSGSGEGTGSGTGIGSGGGTGGSGAGDQPGQRQGSETGRLNSGGETVFVPGKGPGIPTEIQAGPGTGTAPAALRPYTEVVGEYAQQAREHLERSAVPAGYQDLVRRYFAELED